MASSYRGRIAGCLTLWALDRSIRRQLGELARDAGSLAVTDRPLAAPGGSTLSTGGLAAIYDHRDVRIVGVIVGELVEQLIRQRLWNDAVDHGRRCYWSSPIT